MPGVGLINAQWSRFPFVRFILIGVVNTGFSYAVYAVLLLLGFHYAVANLVALILGIVFSFRTQGRFVFYNSSQQLFLRFVFGWLA